MAEKRKSFPQPLSQDSTPGLAPASMTGPFGQTEAAQPTQKSNQGWRWLFYRWQFWSLASLSTVVGVGVVSAVSLFRIPNLPNCRAIFWPTASATTRVQCAEAYAEGFAEAVRRYEGEG